MFMGPVHREDGAHRQGDYRSETKSDADPSQTERLVGVGVSWKLGGQIFLMIGSALLLYAIALWWLAPDIAQRAISIVRRLVARVPGPRRRTLLETR